jgi:2-succinyl-6-hydroxy-2,4-cyclohexadiene-1-carboxylate synthase
MAFAEINGLNYHYELNGDGPLLLLLHGFSGSLENWRPHAVAFSEQYQVIIVDLPGHGQTDAPKDSGRYGIEKTTADLIVLIEQMGFAPAHLLGYSMGARLALYVALAYPNHVQSLIIESGSPGLASEDERRARIWQDEALAERIERDGVTAFIDYWENMPLFASQKNLPTRVKQQLRQQRLRNRPEGLANSLRGMGTGVQPSLWQRLGELKMPVLLLAGALDIKFVGIARQMYDRISNARLVIVPDVGHTVHLEAPTVFQTRVLEFLSQQ